MNYELHPIPKSQLDLATYLLVKVAMVLRSGKAFKHYAPEFPFEEEWHLKELAHTLREKNACLVFPAHHPVFRMYPKEVTQYDAIIAVYTEVGNWSVNNTVVPPVLECFYTIDRQEGTEESYVLTRHEPWEEGIPHPSFPDAVITMMEAIENILLTMQEAGLTDHEWSQRFRQVRMMIREHADGLHILHQAGLFDHANLWETLQKTGVDGQMIGKAKEELTTALARFAMFVVNGLFARGTISPSSVPPQPHPQQPTYNRPMTREPEPVRSEKPKSYANTEMPQKEKPQEQKPIRQEESKEEKNHDIRKRVLWFTIGILVIIFLIWIGEYFLAGTVTAIGGGVIGLITVKIREMVGDYQYEYSLGKRMSLVFVGLLGPFILLFPCRALAQLLYDTSSGRITPSVPFLMVLGVMTIVLLWAHGRKKTARDKAWLFDLLKVLAVAVIIGQGLGSISVSKRSSQDNNHQELTRIDETD